MKLANLINLKPLKEGSMQAQELADRNSLQQLQSMYDQLMRDMEQEAEPEGGPIADQYADQMQDIEDAMAIKNPFKKGSVGGMTYDQAIGRVPKDQFTKSSKFDRMNEATEKAWNAVDVSRKAEKAISNKEWNERTSKKLDMLKKLNDAGKFKKDFDDERLQGWVDQNYSWEKLSKQFKLNEGSCGYGPDGVPGDTPGETQGMDADDRTRGMLRMLIQKEIKKLSEEGMYIDDDEWEEEMGRDPKFGGLPMAPKKNPRGTKRKDKNMQGGPLRKGNVNYRDDKTK